MKNALLLHSIQGNPDENWLPWLKERLEEKGYLVYVPEIISSDKPNLEETFKLVSKNFDFNQESLLVGHSSGAVLALGILQKLPKAKRIKKTILVAPFFNTDLKEDVFKFVSLSDYENTFPKKWDFKKIKNSSGSFIIFDSSTDPFVGLNQGDFLEGVLGAKRVTLEDAEHFSVFTTGEKFRKFPEILEYI